MISFLPLQEQDELYMCGACGGVVVRRLEERHLEWHDERDRNQFAGSSLQPPEPTAGSLTGPLGYTSHTMSQADRNLINRALKCYAGQYTGNGAQHDVFSFRQRHNIPEQ